MAPPENTTHGRSVSEADFFRQIGMDREDTVHLQIYELMQTEAIAGLQRMTQANSGGDASEVDFRAEVLRIYQGADPSTKPVYDRGATLSNGTMTDNWVIRWMLWEAMHQPNGR
ncbi:hypothetical protein Slin15195_G023020 [Septoria linicola]|uniref:Uncharacterized protein n=1 Tax=Septoria linicola TaxID=215465 RepID=A0A9Q9AL55_9PEZI|nr:hypothetical protein Slin14017_G022120 [Septoria linicola]USW48983.1 hypothetical protein Slin15195_G023020 [Septoria linicola]